MGAIKEAAAMPIVIIKRRDRYCTDYHSRTCPCRDMGGDRPRALYCQPCLTYKGRHRA